MYTSNPSLMTWLRQSMATSGRKPSEATLQAILDAENNAQMSKELAREGTAERKREFDLQLEANEDARKSSSTSGLASSASQLGMLYAMMGNKTPKIDPATGKEAPGMLSKAYKTAGRGIDAVKGLFNKTPTTPTAPVMSPAEAAIAQEASFVPAAGTTAAGGSTLSAVPVTAPIANASGTAATGAMELAPTASIGAGAGAGGATLGGIAGAAALPVALGTIGMPYLGSIMGQAAEDVSGIDPKGSNTVAQLNRVVGRGAEGVVTPFVEEVLGQNVPDIVTALTNPAGYLLGGGKGDKCLGKIVTACTAEGAEEVQITREYRNKYMTNRQVRGYYMICDVVVPLIKNNDFVKRMFKRFLVDNLIEYGRHLLRNGKKPCLKSKIITRTFLGLCGFIGTLKESYIRSTGEVY